MDFLKEHQRNEQQQLLHYRKGIQEAEMQFVFTAEGIWETDWDKWEKRTIYKWMRTTTYGEIYGVDLIKNPTGRL